MTKVFVYGTLKRGYGANRKLSEDTFLGKALTNDMFSMYSTGGFPMLHLSGPNRGYVLGELYEVSDGTLKVLDAYEGYPHFYNRKTINICNLTTEEKDVEALVYYIPGDTNPHQPVFPDSVGVIEWKRE